jgi:CIC family chloride channel protein
MKQTIANAPAILVQCSNGWYAARKDELEKLLAEFGGDPERAEAHRALEAFLGKERTPLVFPDQPLASALRFFQRWPVLPVSNRASRGTLEGIVSLEDVLHRYQASIT